MLCEKSLIWRPMSVVWNRNTEAIRDVIDRVIEGLGRDAVQVAEFSEPHADSVIIDIRHPDEEEVRPLSLAPHVSMRIEKIPFYELRTRFGELPGHCEYLLYCEKGIMSRLGFDDDTALESGMVSKTIEGAQTRVEGYNFDARKHVVQYDDVINRQRETIYHERERILRARDLAPTILAMVTDEVASLVAEHTAGDRDEWNREGLKARLQQMVPNLDPALLSAVDGASSTAELTDALIAGVEAAYEAKRAETGEEGMRVLERLVLLRVIDSLWIEHLTAIDDMRRGIGLRAYSQRDPLNEFKVEAYRMFDELKSTIRHDVSHTVFRVTVTREQQPRAQQPRRMTEGRLEMGGAAAAAASAAGGPVATASSNGDGTGAGGSRQQVRAGPKIGRNDPCYCGSGKKYKRCHGA